MQDHFQSPFDSKFLIERSRHQPSKPSDPQAVEPWEKSVLEIQVQQPIEAKNYKTLYPIPFHRLLEKRERSKDRKYETQQQFSFRKQQQMSENLQKIHWNKTGKMNLQIASHQSTISHYNINGNFLQEMLPKDKKKNNKQFILRSPSKQEKLKPIGERRKDIQTSKLASNVELIKRRVFLSKHASNNQDRHFVQLHTDYFEQNQDKNYGLSPLKRKRKVISLGFRKFSNGPRLLKQRSVSLNPTFDL